MRVENKPRWLIGDKKGGHKHDWLWFNADLFGVAMEVVVLSKATVWVSISPESNPSWVQQEQQQQQQR